MDYNTALHILRIEKFSHTCHDHDWKFQPLAFVNAHNTDCIRLFICKIRLSIIHIIFFELFDIPHKIEQSLIAGSFIGCCLCDQHLYICHSLCTTRHRRNTHTVPRFFYNLPQQIMHRCIWKHIPEFRHPAKEVFQFLLQDWFLLLFIIRRIGVNRFIEKEFRIRTSYLCQFSRIQPRKR